MKNFDPHFVDSLVGVYSWHNKGTDGDLDSLTASFQFIIVKGADLCFYPWGVPSLWLSLSVSNTPFILVTFLPKGIEG